MTLKKAIETLQDYCAQRENCQQCKIEKWCDAISEDLDYCPPAKWPSLEVVNG